MNYVRRLLDICFIMSLQNLPNIGLTTASVMGEVEISLAPPLQPADAPTSKNRTVDRDRLTTAIQMARGRDQRPCRHASLAGNSRAKTIAIDLGFNGIVCEFSLPKRGGGRQL